MQNLAVAHYLNIDSDEINILRKKYDPSYNLIRPHITLFFPSPDVLENQLLQHVEFITKNLKSFPINLNGLFKSFDNYLFLLIKEGNEEIIRMHNTLYSDQFADYLSKDIPFVPHVTLGYFGTESNFNQESFEKALKEAEGLNINCTFDTVSIINGDGITSPKTLKTYKLK